MKANIDLGERLLEISQLEYNKILAGEFVPHFDYEDKFTKLKKQIDSEVPSPSLFYSEYLSTREVSHAKTIANQMTSSPSSHPTNTFRIFQKTAWLYSSFAIRNLKSTKGLLISQRITQAIFLSMNITSYYH